MNLTEVKTPHFSALEAAVRNSANPLLTLSQATQNSPTEITQSFQTTANSPYIKKSNFSHGQQDSLQRVNQLLRDDSILHTLQMDEISLPFAESRIREIVEEVYQQDTAAAIYELRHKCESLSADRQRLQEALQQERENSNELLCEIDGLQRQIEKSHYFQKQVLLLKQEMKNLTVAYEERLNSSAGETFVSEQQIEDMKQKVREMEVLISEREEVIALQSKEISSYKNQSKESQLQIRVQELEQENTFLKLQLSELEKVREQLESRFALEISTIQEQISQQREDEQQESKSIQKIRRKLLKYKEKNIKQEQEVKSLTLKLEEEKKRINIEQAASLEKFREQQNFQEQRMDQFVRKCEEQQARQCLLEKSLQEMQLAHEEEVRKLRALLEDSQACTRESTERQAQYCQTIKSHQTDISALQARCTQLAIERSDLGEKNKSLSKELAYLRQDLEKSEQERQELEKRLQSSQSELQFLQSCERAAIREKEGVQIELARANAACKESGQKVRQTELELQSVKIDKDQQEQLCELLEKKLIATHTAEQRVQLHTMKNEYEDCQKQLEAAQTAQEREQQTVLMLAQENRSYSTQLLQHLQSNKKSTNEDLFDEKLSLQENNHLLENKVVSIQKKLEQKIEEICRLQRINDTQTERLAVLKQQAETLKNDNVRLNSDLKSFRQKNSQLRTSFEEARFKMRETFLQILNSFRIEYQTLKSDFKLQLNKLQMYCQQDVYKLCEYLNQSIINRQQPHQKNKPLNILITQNSDSQSHLSMINEAGSEIQATTRQEIQNLLDEVRTLHTLNQQVSLKYSEEMAVHRQELQKAHDLIDMLLADKKELQIKVAELNAVSQQSLQNSQFKSSEEKKHLKKPFTSSNDYGQQWVSNEGKKHSPVKHLKTPAYFFPYHFDLKIRNRSSSPTSSSK